MQFYLQATIRDGKKYLQDLLYLEQYNTQVKNVQHGKTLYFRQILGQKNIWSKKIMDKKLM